MLWTEIRKWAKELGYESIKNKEDGKYYWKYSSSENANDCGIVSSVSKLAKAIYNHHTQNKWLDHQKQFEDNKQAKVISLTDYGT